MMMAARRRLAVAAIVLASACGDGWGGRDGPTMTPTATTSPTPIASPAVVTWAVGSFLVARSDDAGVSWRTVFDSRHPLWGVDFLDRMTGWVVGGSNIFRTTNGGANGDGRDWESQDVNVVGGVELYDVAFLDSDHGVAIGRTSSRAVALATADGGAHWQRAALGTLATTAPSGTWLTRLCLSRDGSGAAVGSGLFFGTTPLAITTVDGGMTWTDRTQRLRATARAEELTLANCAHPSATELWIVGAPGFLAQSFDGGVTWNRRTVTIRRNVLLNAVLVGNQGRAWVSGFDPDAREILIFRTRDGGATWDEHVLATNVLIVEQLPQAALTEIRPDTILFAGEDNSFFPGRAHALSFVTSDSGDTWTPSNIPGGVSAFWDLDVVP